MSNTLFKYFHKIMVGLGRYRIINDRQDNEPYLERYYLFIKDRKWFPFNIFLHKFLKSDPDDLHDHPWPYMTIILRGGYWEHTKNTNGDIIKKWWGAGSIRCAAATQLHRIVLDEKIKETWTLFIPGCKKREWGFETSKGWIKNNEYLEQKKQQN